MISRPRVALTIAGGLTALVVLAALLAPLLAPYGPSEPIGPALSPPSRAHLLGTNDVGQDIVSRLIWGARTSLRIAAIATGVALLVGSIVGIGAGLAGGLADAAAMRLVDLLIAVPRLPLLIVIAAMMPTNGTALAWVVGGLAWPAVARILRSETLTLRTRGYLRAARGAGAGTMYLLRRHLVPSVAPLIVAQGVLVASNVVLVEASLAFLGLADPVEVSWGRDIQRAVSTTGIYSIPAWLWWVLPTGIAISLTILALVLLGIALEPFLDRRWQRPA